MHSPASKIRRYPGRRCEIRFVPFLLVVLFSFSFSNSANAQNTHETPRSFPGTIEALNTVDISNMIAGVITEVHFQPGEFVSKGDVLFTMDDTDFVLAVENKRLNALRAESAQQSARRDFERVKTLKEKGSATDVQMFKSEIAFVIGDAAAAQANAELKVAEAELSRTRILAPISGVITPSEVRPGTYVKKGRGALARIDQMDPVRLSYEFPYVQRLQELELDDLSSPEELLKTITLTVKLSDDWTYPETTGPDNVSSRVDFATGTMTVWAVLPNPKFVLRPGLRVTVIPERSKN